MEFLDDYCLLYIFQFFSMNDRLNVSKVCTRWHNVMRRLWKIRKLSISFNESSKTGVDSIEYNYFQELLEYCGLDLNDITIILANTEENSTAVIEFEANIYKIEEINISDVLNMLIKTSGYITSLTFCFNNKCPVNLFNKLLTYNQQLQKLEIDGNCIEYLNNMKFEELPNTLEEMILSFLYCETDTNLCLFLQEASNLRILKIIETNILTDKLLLTVSASAKQLRVIHLEHDVDEDDEISGMAIASISELINLEEFSIKGFSKSLTDGIVIKIVSGCQKIKIFSLSDCSQITNKSIYSLMSLLSHLEIFEMKNLNITALIPSNIQVNLKKLKIYNCSQLSDVSLCETVSVMLYLTNLDITFNISDKIIFSVMSIVLLRNQIFQIIEDISSSEEQYITIYKNTEFYSEHMQFNNKSFFYFHYYPRLHNSLELIQNHVINNFPEYKISHEIKKIQK